MYTLYAATQAKVMVHIILLTQASDQVKTRQWQEFTSVHDCCKQICEMFEIVLRKQYAFRSEIVYDITDLYAYIDNVS